MAKNRWRTGGVREAGIVQLREQVVELGEQVV